MKIEFKLEGAAPRDTFQALSNMLDVLNRSDSLNADICSAMDTDPEIMPEFIDITYIEAGYQVEFYFHKRTGKIRLMSRKVKYERNQVEH
jgi:hypothetical protein